MVGDGRGNKGNLYRGQHKWRGNLETRRRRRRDSEMEQTIYMKKQRRRCVHTDGRGKHQASTAPSLCATRWRQQCSAAPGSHGPWLAWPALLRFP
eukprot:gene10995-biopygen9378